MADTGITIDKMVSMAKKELKNFFIGHPFCTDKCLGI